MRNTLKIIGAIVLVIVLSAGLALLFAWPAMLLWNWLVPIIASGAIPTLTYWQMVGLMILLRLLIPTGSSRSSNKD